MFLFDTLHMASTSMSANQLGMQVVGQNMTNAQTPGYVRESLNLQTNTSLRTGNGIVVGTGVQVTGITQVIDKFLEERLRNSISDSTASATQEKYYSELEALLNELTQYDLSTSIETFFNSIDNIQNHPENITYRQMAIEQGDKLAKDVNRISDEIINIQRNINSAISSAADDINKLLSEINELNKGIAHYEAGNVTNSNDAIGLRDQRLTALTKLSEYINIKTIENPLNGSVAIYCGSDILLMDGVQNELFIRKQYENPDSIFYAEICVRNSMTPLDVRSGNVAGLYQANKEILGNFGNELDNFATSLINEFNKIYSSGQGLTGYENLTSMIGFDKPDQAISANPNLNPPINNGGFYLQLYDPKTTTTIDYYIPVEVAQSQQVDPFSLKKTPPVAGTSINDIANTINSINGINASVNTFGELEISVGNSGLEFAFANDTSGVLAAIGMNTFFTGNSAQTIGINQTVLNDPSKFAASKNGIGHDVDNSIQLSAMSTKPVAGLKGMTVIDFYDGIVSEVMLSAGTMKSIATTDALYQASIQAQRDSISGVNIEEEIILMMTYQRNFQANSRLVTTINEMMQTLIDL
ncbi:MAG: flagellar hook-associated protein FlgK [Planctomycetaceae bacterium]|jgi:flagellar hook-associated protein 1 FlgK|nr:flagellar hook-associated protein FlgK [Planctomycetaceae bacterium]